MLDLKLVREEPDRVRVALARRGRAEAVDELLELDALHRELLPQVEGERAAQNRAGQAIAEAKRTGDDAAAAIEEMRTVKARIDQLQSEASAVKQRLDALIATLPNLPAESAPDEEEVLREVGDGGRTGRDHLELLGGLVDMEAGARLSGSRFAYLRGPLVMLELALVRWAMELLSGEGFEPVVPPVLVREEALFGTGFLPDTEQQIYELRNDELYLSGTSEVALAMLHGGQILDAGALPRRYAGFSTCFRREAGAAGKDTRGIFRVHQFDKVEMFSFVEPGESEEEQERLLEIEERIFQALAIPYRVVNIPVSDLGASAAKKYDLEAWLPGQDRYREVTACANTTEYQARRLGARYRPEAEAPPRHLHTLNGTAIAVGRTIIAIAENHQHDDESVAIPEVLHAYGAPAEIAAAES